MKKQKLYVGFNWIFYTLASICRPDEFPLTVSGQRSLMKVTLKHTQVKANLGINSFVARLYKKEFPEMLDLAKKGVEDGHFEITSMTHSEDIISCLPYDEMIREVVWNIDTLEKVFGVRPKGAYNPEQSWDPFSGKVYSDSGIEWIAISNWQLYKMGYPEVEDKRELFMPAYLRTVEDRKIKAAFNSLEPGQWGVPDDFRYGPCVFLAEYLHGRQDDKFMPSAFERLREMNVNEKMLILFCEDSEDFWRSPFYGLTDLSQHDMEKRFDRFLSFLESLPYVEFITISEYLQKVSPEKVYYIRPSVGLFNRDGFGIWERGMFGQAYNLNIQCNRIGEDIRHAELMIRLAKKRGTDTARVESLIREAWENLGLARTASGRGYRTTEPFTMWCSDHANKAMQLAKEAIDEIINLL